MMNKIKRKSKKQIPLVRLEPKVGRNAPCPCGSGKKFKRCCALKPVDDLSLMDEEGHTPASFANVDCKVCGGSGTVGSRLTADGRTALLCLEKGCSDEKYSNYIFVQMTEKRDAARKAAIAKAKAEEAEEPTGEKVDDAHDAKSTSD